MQLNPVKYFRPSDNDPSKDNEMRNKYGKTLKSYQMVHGISKSRSVCAYSLFLNDHCMGRKQFKQFIRNHKQFPSFVQAKLLPNRAGNANDAVTEIAETFSRIHTCSVCGRLATNKCGECLATYYCDTECQKEDWSKHQVNCQTLKQELYFLRLQPPIQEYFEAKYKKPVVSFHTFMKVIKRKCYELTYNREW